MVIISKDTEAERNRIISKGGSVKETKKKHANILLRIPTQMLEEIDARVKQKAGFKRTTWILQALEEKLDNFD